jgi:hypothetical protein
VVATELVVVVERLARGGVGGSSCCGGDVSVWWSEEKRRNAREEGESEEKKEVKESEDERTGRWDMAMESRIPNKQRDRGKGDAPNLAARLLRTKKNPNANSMAAPAIPTTTNTPTTAPVLLKKPEPEPPPAALLRLPGFLTTWVTVYLAPAASVEVTIEVTGEERRLYKEKTEPGEKWGG